MLAFLPTRVRQGLLAVAELALVCWAWYGFIGARWQEGALPMGQEYPRNMHSLFFWENVQQCGQCAYWADVMGGYPVFADVFGSFYHPLAMAMSFVYGAVTGSAMTVAASFLLIALAAWWLGQLLALHPVARVWYALIAMFGGQMGSRLELGSIGMPLATAAAWLAFVALYAFILQPNRWRATAAGAALGMLWCAGQGYFQLGMILAIPVFGVFTWYYRWWEDNRGAKILLTAWTGLLSVLIAAPLLVNIVWYRGLFSKDYDIEFTFAQPIERALQNMAVGRFDIAKSTVLNAYAFPWAYSTYIGFFTVMLGCVAVFVARETLHQRIARLLVGCAAVWLFVASGTPQRMVAALGNEALTKSVSSLRFLVLLDGLATLAIATLAALSIHAFVTTTSLPPLFVRARSWSLRWLRFNVFSLVVAYLCVLNLSDVMGFVNNWVYDAPPFTEQQIQMAQSATSLDGATVDAGPDWMHLPLLAEHVNVTNLHMAWQIDNKDFPPAEYTFRQDVPDGTHVVDTFDDEWKLVRSDDPDTRYAAVIAEDNTTTPCAVDASRGGDIQVTCDTPRGGVVRVYEHNLSGWELVENGRSSAVHAGSDWLTADIGPGVQSVHFRYAPWQTTAAIVLNVLGWLAVVGIAVWSVVRSALRWQQQLRAVVRS